MIQTHSLFFFIIIILFSTSSTNTALLGKQNPTIIWKNQDKSCHVAILPADTIHATTKYLNFYNVINLKKTCTWTNETIIIEDPITWLNDVKNSNLLFFNHLSNNASLCTKILVHYAHQHKNFVSAFKRNIIDQDFVTKSNDLKNRIKTVWSIHPDKSSLERPKGYKEPETIENLEDLIPVLLLQPSDTKKEEAAFSKLKKELAGESWLASKIPYVKDTLEKYGQFTGHIGLLEGLCCLGDIGVMNAFLSTENRGINYHEETTMNNRNWINNYTKKSALYFACKHGKCTLIQFLIAQGATIGNDNLLTCLIGSGCQSHDDDSYYKTIELLLRNGANPNKIMLYKSYNGMPFLHSLCYQRNIKYAKLLLKYNAKIDVCNEYDKNNIFHVLLLPGQRTYSDCDDCLKLAELFIQQENALSLINQPNDKNYTPLHLAAKKSFILTEFLLKHGANPNTIHPTQGHPLVIAKKFPDIQILLLRYGAIPFFSPLLQGYAVGITIFLGSIAAIAALYKNYS